jgi:hypothetical protein
VIQNVWNGFSNKCHLFEQWGSTLAVVAGVLLVYCYFLLVLLFISYGTPWMGFRDEFGWSKNKGAWSLGE